MSELTPWRTFSIFISSTFADMQAERDHLKTYVFPRVEEELRKQRIRLETVDLRWGVDTAKIKKEDEREASVLKVCLDEIKRCRPFFIGLLGDRYGWVPPEERMENAVLGEEMETDLKGKSVTALEIEFGVLASKEQLSRSVFYFREPFNYSKFSPEKAAVFTDEHNPELTEEEKKNRTSSLAKLKTDIVDHFKKQGLTDGGLKTKVKPYSGKWDTDKQEVTNLESWGNIVYDDIIRECNDHNKETRSEAPKNWQEEEMALLDAFIEGHTHITTRGKEDIPTFCGRENLLGKLKNHLLLKDKENWGLVLTGESGSGKSAVFSMVYKMMQQEDCFVLAHSAGLSPKAKNVIDLLQIWNKQLSDELGIEYLLEEETKSPDKHREDVLMPEMEGAQQKAPKLEIEKIQDKFRELLFTVAEKKRVVLLIDALDRFAPTERARYMTWLPTVMPGNIRMLCTAITGTEQKAVEYHSGLFVKGIDFFTPGEAEEMLTMLCKRQHKNLPDKVQRTILEKKREDGNHATSSPLWLSLAVNILMAMDNDDFEKMKQLEGRGDEVIEDYMQSLALNFPPLPGKLFLSLINKAASIFDTNFTHKVFNYIACSRDGLRESDLEKLMPHSREENWDALLFANLRRWFSAHLREEGEGLQWNLVHSILRNSLLKTLENAIFKSIHNTIALHLINLSANDTLKITESMYHLMQAENDERALDYYIGSTTKEEKDAATKVLAEAISEDKKGLDWCFKLMEAAKEDDIKLWKLAPRFIYDLNDTLELEGNLDNRINLLKNLTTWLLQTGSNYRLNTDYGYDFGALYSQLGAIYQALGKFDQALEYFNKYNNLTRELYESNPKNESLKNGLAISYSQLGEIYQALGNFDQALEYFKLRSDLGKELYESNPKNESLKNGLVISYSKLGAIYQALGKFDQALEYFNKVVLLFEELYESNPKNESLKNGLAISYEELGAIYQALGNFDQALEYFKLKFQLNQELYRTNPKNEKNKTDFAISYERLGEINQALGNFDQALEYFNKYIELSRELYESNPKNESLKNGLAISYSKLGAIYQALGNFDQALEYFNKYNNLSRELYESNPKNESLKNNLAISYFKLGEIYKALGNFDQALEYLNNYNNLSRELYESNPKNESLKNGLAISYEKLGDIYQALGNFDQALEYFKLKFQLNQELYRTNPKNEKNKIDFAISYERLGAIYQALGNFDQALEYFKLRSDLGKELYESNPKNESLKNGLAISYFKLGATYQALGNFDQALEYFNKEVLLFEELYESNPKNESLKNGLAISYEKLGDIYQALGNFDQALEYFKLNFQLNQELYRTNPKNEKNKTDFAISYSKLGEIYQVLGNFDQALEYFNKSNNLTRELYESNPKNEKNKTGFAFSYGKLGYIYQALGNFGQALEYFNNYNSLTRELYESNPKNESLKNGLAISYGKLGEIYQALGNFDQALEYFNKYIELSRELYENNPKNMGLLEILAISYNKLASAYKAMGNHQEGKENFAEWKRIISYLAENIPQVAKYKQWDGLEY